MQLKRYYHTLKYLKPIQIFGRIWFKIKITRPDFRPAPPLRKKSAAWNNSITKKQSILGSNTFVFLNQQHQLAFPKGWNDPELKKLWLYNLHYFDDLNAKDSQARKAWHIELIHQWMKDNPPPKGNGWEPYTLSLRIVNWIKWSLSGHEFSANMLNSLATQVRFLNKRLEYHLLGNHLLANAKALIFAGLFFAGPEANGWLKKGIKILSKQLKEQILPDGGHFERSTMYHAIILEDILDLINLSQTYNFTIPYPLYDTAQKMLAWLECMTHPDGEIVLFNDAAFNIAPRFSELLTYAENLKITLTKTDSNKSILLDSTGYAHLTKNNAHVYIDAAPLGPDYLSAHGHADTLSFEFSLGIQRIIVDSGTSLYEISDNRSQQRSTHAHNTVIIDDQNSSETWSSFRVARRANVNNIQLKETSEKIIFSACHDGYKRLIGKPVHKRTWELKNSELIIHDEVLGAGIHNLEIALHLHPNLKVRQIIDHSFNLLDAQNTILVALEFDPKLFLRILPNTYHPQFNKSTLNQKITGGIRTELPFSSRLILRW